MRNNIEFYNFNSVIYYEDNTIKVCDEKKFPRILEIFAILDSLYPNFHDWVLNKCIKEDRELILCRANAEIVGLSILKESSNKICSFIILPEYRNIGLGTALLKGTIPRLKSNLPILIYPKEKYKSVYKHMFEQHSLLFLSDYESFIDILFDGTISYFKVDNKKYAWRPLKHIKKQLILLDLDDISSERVYDTSYIYRRCRDRSAEYVVNRKGL